MLSRRHPGVFSVYLLMQLAQRVARMEPKPPVTLFFVALNMAIHYASRHARFNTFAALSLRRACLRPSVALSEPWRLVLASVVHVSDVHVLYNCLSLVAKGVLLEHRMGSARFFALIVYLSISAHAVYVALAYILPPRFLLHRCVAGFSGILFGLNVILRLHPRYKTHARHAPPVQIPFIGAVLPAAALAPWYDLVVTSILVPNASFTGHLAGIIAGLAFVYAPRAAAALVAALLATLRRRRGTPAFRGEGRHLHTD